MLLEEFAQTNHKAKTKSLKYINGKSLQFVKDEDDEEVEYEISFLMLSQKVSN